MKKLVIKLSLSIFAFGITNLIYAQDLDKGVLNWYNGDAGMKTEAAYKKVKKRESKTVIVAIIDSGIDIEHEDLKGKIWTNTDEIPENGIDDDNNGYIDDVHGWNFLGNANGQNANSMRLERTRLVAKWADKFEDADPATLNASEKKDYATYMQAKEELEEERASYEGYVQQLEIIPMIMASVPGYIEKELGAGYTLKDLKKWSPTDPEQQQMRSLAIAMETGDLKLEDIEAQRKQIQGMLDTHHNVDFNGREVIGDDPDDFSDVKYGNPDVEGPDALHGTHVGGIVGAIRGNKLGGDGVAENVLLMSIRAVPDGDEYDKDIALAIRYAVDNGAEIINMSFGKGYSPHAKEVYAAFEYADSKGVLLVHAAGNDSKDLDDRSNTNFPTSMYDFQTKKLDHFLTIGSMTRQGKVVAEKPEKIVLAKDASKEEKAEAKAEMARAKAAYKRKKKSKMPLPSRFSNYGQTHVDVFAPGSEIYNAVPQSDYQGLQGTAMASPMVAGAAAFLKSYFPEVSMKEIKEVLLASATSYKGSMQVLPGEKDDFNTDAVENAVDFGTLSVTGSVINLENAVMMLLAKEKK